MAQARSTACIRAGCAASLAMLGAGALNVAEAQVGDQGGRPGGYIDLTANDPNAIRGFKLNYGVTVDEILTDNARGTATGGTLLVNGVGTATTTGGTKQGDLVTRVTPNVTAYDITRRVEL